MVKGTQKSIREKSRIILPRKSKSLSDDFLNHKSLPGTIDEQLLKEWDRQSGGTKSAAGQRC
jgi:hypothetical protein